MVIKAYYTAIFTIMGSSVFDFKWWFYKAVAMNYKHAVCEMCHINFLTILVTVSVSLNNQCKEKKWSIFFHHFQSLWGVSEVGRSWGNIEIHTLLNDKKSLFNKTLVDHDFLSVQYGT